MAIDCWFPIPTKTPNLRQHWGKTYQLRNKQRYWIGYIMILHKKNIPDLPCTITLTRTGPNLWDDDNSIYSLKYIREAIAEHLTKNYISGRADGDPRLTWVYKQEKGKLGIKIQIFHHSE